MSDREYIERGALIEFVRSVRKRLPIESKDFFTRDEMLLNFQQYLELQKAADVEPVVRGEWKETGGYGMFHQPIIECSVCGDQIEETKRRKALKRCPNCGAHMGERSKHED